MRKLFLIFFIIIYSSFLLYGSDSSILSFDNYSAGVIGRGMVDTGWNESISFYGNPANLSEIKNIGFSISYWKWFMDMSFMSSSIVYPIGKGSIGLNLDMFDSGDFTLFDNSGESLEKISGENILINLGYGHPLSFLVKGLSSGINIKYINSRLYLASSQTIAFDVGFLYKMDLVTFGVKRNFDNFFIGIDIKNIGNSFKYSQEKSELPLRISLGIKHNIFQNKILNLCYGFDLNKERDKFTFQSGMEINLYKLIVLRGGYSTDSDIANIFSGIGINYSKNNIDFNFDYSLIPITDFGLSHNITINIILKKTLFKEKKVSQSVEDIE